MSAASVPISSLNAHSLNIYCTHVNVQRAQVLTQILSHYVSAGAHKEVRWTQAHLDLTCDREWDHVQSLKKDMRALRRMPR
jgi:hypothetical protein